MKTVSTGMGLIVLAGAVVLHSWSDRHLPGIAGVRVASGDTPEAIGTAPDVMHSDHLRGKRGQDASARRMTMGSPAGCIDDQSLNWVTTVRPLPDCFYYDMHDDEDAEDWNGDGRVDFVNPVWGVTLLRSGAVAAPECIAVVTDTTWDGKEVSITRSCIADSAALLSYVVQVFPGRSVSTGSAGWRDLDGDGDLDYVVQLFIDDFADESWVWLENTGFEADPPPLAADINQDGVVDGKDLASVLAAWTP